MRSGRTSWHTRRIGHFDQIEQIKDYPDQVRKLLAPDPTGSRLTSCSSASSDRQDTPVSEKGLPFPAGLMDALPAPCPPGNGTTFRLASRPQQPLSSGHIYSVFGHLIDEIG